MLINKVLYDDMSSCKRIDLEVSFYIYFIAVTILFIIDIKLKDLKIEMKIEIK